MNPDFSKFKYLYLEFISKKDFAQKGKKVGNIYKNPLKTPKELIGKNYLLGILYN